MTIKQMKRLRRVRAGWGGKVLVYKKNSLFFAKLVIR